VSNLFRRHLLLVQNAVAQKITFKGNKSIDGIFSAQEPRQIAEKFSTFIKDKKVLFAQSADDFGLTDARKGESRLKSFGGTQNQRVRIHWPDNL
jgi:hypothetical protein